MPNAYTDGAFLGKVNIEDVQVAFECGTHHGEDAAEIAAAYGAHVYAFEASHHNIDVCVAKSELMSHPNVTFIPLALNNYTGLVSFNEVDMERSGDKNDGASSILDFNYDRPSSMALSIESKKYKVPCVSLDYACKMLRTAPQLLCLDAQGSEKNIILGGKEIISQYVKYIITEVNYFPYYKELPLYDEIVALLGSLGFEMAYRNQEHSFGDALFIKKP